MHSELVHVLGLILSLSGASAVVPAPERFDAVSLEHGLGQSTVYAIQQTDRGLLVVGTENGLSTYDGYRFRPAGGALGRQTILALERDCAGALWAATLHNGLLGLDPTSGAASHHVPTPDALGPGGTEVRALADGSGRGDPCDPSRQTLWVGSEDGGVVAFDPVTGVGTRPHAHLPRRGVRSLAWDPDGLLWVVTESGAIHRYDARADRVTTHALDQGVATMVLVDRQGGPWVGTRDHGVAKLDRATGTPIASFAVGTLVRAMLADQQGTMTRRSTRSGASGPTSWSWISPWPEPMASLWPNASIATPFRWPSWC